MTKKKVAIIGVSSVVLVAMVVAVAVGVNRTPSASGGDTAGISSASKSVQQICQPTDYKKACVQTLSAAGGNTTDPMELIKVAFTSTIKEISVAVKNSSLLKEAAKDPRTSGALKNCEDLLDDSIGDLQRSFEKVGSFDVAKMDDYLNDMKTWLSGAITYQQTCIDGFENTTGDAGQQMKKLLKLSGELTSNGLAIVNGLSQILSTTSFASLAQRKLLSEEPPEWVSGGQRRLLASTPATVKPNVVVAQDGSGKYKTIGEALKDVPKNNTATFVIYIKAGVYKEYIAIPKNTNGVFLLGDGPTKTKITGSKSYAGGYTTYRTATVSADGDRFMAKDLGIENSAGAENHQAVALRVSSDLAVLHNCQIDGYQDTLYAHVHRHFYRDCTISGTVDFIFGDASAVFQNCRLLLRRPLNDQQCLIIAQGRTDKRAVTGTVLQNCTVAASPEYLPVRNQFQAFLGRPWKNFSRTVIMQSEIDSVIDPAGWAPWSGRANLDTLWYAEYENRGPGADRAKRVNWKGIQKKITPEVAETFTPKVFIGGDSWIPATGVPYVSGMVSV